MALLPFGRIFGVTSLALGLALAVQTARVNSIDKARKEAIAAQHNPATGKLWKAEAVAIAANLDVCRDARAKLTAAFNEQNAAVQALKAETERRKAEAQRAAKAATALRARVKATVSQVLASKPSGDQCVAANDLITKFARLP